MGYFMWASSTRLSLVSAAIRSAHSEVDSNPLRALSTWVIIINIINIIIIIIIIESSIHLGHVAPILGVSEEIKLLHRY